MRIHARHGFFPRLSRLPRPVRSPHSPTTKHLTPFLSSRTARIKRHSSTSLHSTSSTTSHPCPPAASQVHPKSASSHTHNAAPFAPPMRVYGSTISAGGATPRRCLVRGRAWVWAQSAAGVPRGRHDYCGAAIAVGRARNSRAIPTQRMCSSSSRPSWSG